jgi:hypothetical protein
MDEQELIRMIDARARKTARRTWNCPSDTAVASYLEQRLEQKERSRFEAHLADCDFCLGIIGDLVRQQRASEPVEVPARLVQRAIDAVPIKANWGLTWRWVLAPALAGVVVASAVLLRSPQPRHSVPSASAPVVEKARPPVAIPQAQLQRPEEPIVRSLKTAAPRLQLLEPRSESVVPREALRFRWRPMANAAYYELRVVNSEGDLMWQGQESKSSAQLPPDVSLRPGKYFVWVHAHLNDGRTIKSETTGFTIASPR